MRGHLDNIVFEVADAEGHEDAVMQVRRTLGRVHHFDAKDKDALFIWDTMEGRQDGRRHFPGGSRSSSPASPSSRLGLGGIGVMNIMLVSVTERTREIGVRKAIGATRDDILRQFFAESVLLTAASGFLGLTFGVGACLALSNLPLPDFVPHPIISPISIVLSIVTLSIITFTAGMYPAQRAADMTPVESLRYE